MVEDQNFLRVKQFFFLIIFFFIFQSNSFSKNYNFQKLIEIDGPWGSSFINNNELIFTEKNGKIKIVDINSKKISEIKHNLNYLVHGQGGLLDILFKDNFIYISYSENRGNGQSSTSIAKAKFNKNKLNFKNIDEYQDYLSANKKLKNFPHNQKNDNETTNARIYNSCPAKSPTFSLRKHKLKS